MITILDSFTDLITYIFIDGTRKYVFHWQDQHQNLIRRWDTAEHHHHLSTFPYHVHTPSSVDGSPPMTLQKILEYIKNAVYAKQS